MANIDMENVLSQIVCPNYRPWPIPERLAVTPYTPGVCYSRAPSVFLAMNWGMLQVRNMPLQSGCPTFPFGNRERCGVGHLAGSRNYPNSNDVTPNILARSIGGGLLVYIRAVSNLGTMS